MKGLAMSELKENRKERTKEKNKENPPPPPPLRSGESLVCHDGDAFKMSVVYEAADKMGFTPQLANKWVDYMDQVDWLFSTGERIYWKNFRRSLRRFGRAERVIADEEARLAEKEARRLARKSGKRRDGSPDYEALEAMRRELEAKRREEASKADGAWDLCAERCANCLGGKHCPFYATPPQLREWPLAPEQCSKFKPLEAKGE